MDRKSVYQNNPPEDWKEVTIHWLTTSPYYKIPWIKKYVIDLEKADTDDEILKQKKKLEKFLKVMESGGELEQDDIDEINRALLWGTLGVGGSGMAAVVDAPEEPSGEPREPTATGRMYRADERDLAEVSEDEIKKALEMPSDFGYSGDLPIGETWAIGPVIRSRDSNIREQSNADVLERELKRIREFDDEWQIVSANHWAVGWVDHLAFHAVDDEGNPTRIFQWLTHWFGALEDYPIADDDDFSRREYEEKLSQIKDEAFRIEDGEPIGPHGFEHLVYSWLENNRDEISQQTRRFLEDPENYGVDKDDIKKALIDLDLFKYEERFHIKLITDEDNPHKVVIFTDDESSALNEEEILDGEWESSSNFAGAVAEVTNTSDLPNELEKLGYVVDKSEWFPPVLEGQESLSFDEDDDEEEEENTKLVKIESITNRIYPELPKRFVSEILEWLEYNKTTLANDTILFLEDPYRFTPNDDDIRRALTDLDLYPDSEDEEEIEPVLPELLEPVEGYESSEDEVLARVIIKGNKEEAIQAAWDRGFVVRMDLDISEGGQNETVLHLVGSHSELVEWHNERGRYPFPPGSLLLFTVI
jgi:hypothetical protein